MRFSRVVALAFIVAVPGLGALSGAPLRSAQLQEHYPVGALTRQAISTSLPEERACFPSGWMA